MKNNKSKPLGMEHPAVINIDSRKNDNAHTFGGISTTIKDLAKIGRLYLNNGMWDGKRIVSEDWIRQTTTLQQHETHRINHCRLLPDIGRLRTEHNKKLSNKKGEQRHEKDLNRLLLGHRQHQGRRPKVGKRV